MMRNFNRIYTCMRYILPNTDKDNSPVRLMHTSGCHFDVKIKLGSTDCHFVFRKSGSMEIYSGTGQTPISVDDLINRTGLSWELSAGNNRDQRSKYIHKFPKGLSDAAYVYRIMDIIQCIKEVFKDL